MLPEPAPAPTSRARSRSLVLALVLVLVLPFYIRVNNHNGVSYCSVLFFLFLRDRLPLVRLVSFLSLSQTMNVCFSGLAPASSPNERLATRGFYWFYATPRFPTESSFVFSNRSRFTTVPVPPASFSFLSLVFSFFFFSFFFFLFI